MYTTSTLRMEAPVVEAGLRTFDTSDEDLLARFYNARDQDAFSQLVQRYQDSAYRVAFARCGCRDLSEDAVQDAFLEVARKQKGGPPACFRTWFLAVVSNTTRHRMRTERRTSRREQSARYLEEARTVATERSKAPEKLMDADTRNALTAALEHLQEDLRLPLVLYFVEGMTQDEVGATVGVSQPLIARRIAQGLEKLRTRLAVGGFAIGTAALPELLRHADFMRAPGGLTSTLSSDSFFQSAVAGGQESMRLAAASTGWGKTFVVVLVLSVTCLSGAVLYLASSKAPKVPNTTKSEVPATVRVYKNWTWDLVKQPPPKEWIYGHQFTWTEGKGFQTTITDKASWVLSPIRFRRPLRVTMQVHPHAIGGISTGLDLCNSNLLLANTVWVIIPLGSMTINQPFTVTSYVFGDYVVHLANDGKVHVVLKYDNAQNFTRMVVTGSNLTFRKLAIEEIRDEDIPAIVRESCIELIAQRPFNSVNAAREVISVPPGAAPPEEMLQRLNAPLLDDAAP